MPEMPPRWPPETADDTRMTCRGAKVARDDEPRQMTEAESEENKKSGGG